MMSDNSESSTSSSSSATSSDVEERPSVRSPPPALPPSPPLPSVAANLKSIEMKMPPPPPDTPPSSPPPPPPSPPATKSYAGVETVQSSSRNVTKRTIISNVANKEDQEPNKPKRKPVRRKSTAASDSVPSSSPKRKAARMKVVDNFINEEDEFALDLEDVLDPDDYSGESDVFEDDVEALLYQERQHEETMGGADAMVDLPTGVKEYPFPGYVAKLPLYFTKDNVFGKHPERYLNGNNLLYNASYMAELDKRANAIERKLLERVRKEQAEAALRAEEQRKLDELEQSLKPPPSKKIKTTEIKNHKPNRSTPQPKKTGSQAQSSASSRPVTAQKATKVVKKQQAATKKPPVANKANSTAKSKNQTTSKSANVVSKTTTPQPNVNPPKITKAGSNEVGLRPETLKQIPTSDVAPIANSSSSSSSSSSSGSISSSSDISSSSSSSDDEDLDGNE